MGVCMYALDPQSQTRFVVPAYMQISDWERKVEIAMREVDPALLTERVHDAEWAIFQRWQALGARGEGTEEWIAIAAAVDGLLSIKIQILKWPDFRMNS
jgi:hypothetical protein